MATSEYKGLSCPNPECPEAGKAGNFTTGQMKKSKDCLTRPKTCKCCGTVFKTVETPVAIIEIKNNHRQ